jgi:hypothetical protein
LTPFVSGMEVLAAFSQGPDGSLTLTALSADGNAEQADDDGGGDHGGGHDGGGGGEHGGGGDH